MKQLLQNMRDGQARGRRGALPRPAPAARPWCAPRPRWSRPAPSAWWSNSPKKACWAKPARAPTWSARCSIKPAAKACCPPSRPPSTASTSPWRWAIPPPGRSSRAGRRHGGFPGGRPGGLRRRQLCRPRRVRRRSAQPAGAPARERRF